MIVGDFNTPQGLLDKKIYKETLELIDPMDQMGLLDIYRVFHLAVVEHRFFSAAHRTVSKMVHILECKSSLSKYKKVEITSYII
jgi:hypothetical protein